MLRTSRQRNVILDIFLDIFSKNPLHRKIPDIFFEYFARTSGTPKYEFLWISPKVSFLEYFSQGFKNIKNSILKEKSGTSTPTNHRFLRILF